ncbi:HAD family hydrolase [Patescibacteria group bacterium]|nr:HAD family hydrolase [Patescibacteria group bacterium]
MNAQFSDVRVLIWDFDGTFYRPNPALFAAVRQAEYTTIMAHTGWDYDRTDREFKARYKVTIQSATETVSVLTGQTVAESAVEMERYFDRRDFLKRDPKLISLFRSLHGYRHMILANGVIARHIETLAVLGIPKETFELMVTSETVGVTKPSVEGFRYIMKHTGLPAPSHMMIGDRPAVDLAPARALGMHTCLVWSETPSDVADITLPTVYALKDVLIGR